MWQYRIETSFLNLAFKAGNPGAKVGEIEAALVRLAQGNVERSDCGLPLGKYLQNPGSLAAAGRAKSGPRVLRCGQHAGAGISSGQKSIVRLKNARRPRGSYTGLPPALSPDVPDEVACEAAIGNGSWFGLPPVSGGSSSSRFSMPNASR